MTNCTDCRYQKNMCKWPCDDCVKGDKWEERPLTNADCIKAMTDEKMAEWLTWICDPYYAPKEGWLKYLKAEATE